MPRVPNPLSGLLLAIGLLLSRFGLVSEERARHTAKLAWPRIVTGLARMSKNAADVAMVGIALGQAAIAGVGIAGPFWGIVFSIGGGLAAGTIALVSQRFGAERFDLLGQAIRSSVAVVVLITLPISALFYLFPVELLSLLSNEPQVVQYGSDYLRIIAFGVPFGALNLIGSRALIGADDAWTPMVLRATGAVINIALNAILIFGLGMGVVGAAVGTVVSNVIVTSAFVVGLSRGSLPGVGALPITVSPRGKFFDLAEMLDIVSIGLPVVGRNSVWTLSQFPLLAIVGLFGKEVLAAYIIARRIWGLINTPGWGFGLAASSLVGQELGKNNEDTAESYGREIVRFSVATYLVAAAVVIIFAEPIVRLFLDDPTNPSFSIAVKMVYVSAVAVVFLGVTSSISGALDSTGDTRWPFYAFVVGMFGFSIPLTYLGATTELQLIGVYLGFFGETVVPAVITYYRFTTGKWKAISRTYRPDAAPLDD